MSLAVNSSTAKLLVAVGDKWGNVGLWDVNDRQAITHGVRCFAVSCRFEIMIKVYLDQLYLCILDQYYQCIIVVFLLI